MTDQDVVERVGRLWGRKASCRPPRQDHHLPVWHSVIQGNPAADLMRLLRPFMGERRRQIDDALASPLRARVPRNIHGSARYKQGCRCETCRAAKHAEYQRRKARAEARA